MHHPWLQNAKKAPNVPVGETVKARLKQFSVMNKFNKKAMRVVAEHLYVEEVAGIKDMFQMTDVSNRGQITIEELKIGLQTHWAADNDGNGTLDYGEFVALSLHSGPD
ncbi:Calcium-dependent protein kinase 14 [Asimina triloba]